LYAVRGGVALAVLALCAACGPSNDYEKAYFEQRNQESREREVFRSKLDGVNEESAALEMVREATSSSGTNSNQRWVERQLEDAGGNVMFGRWNIYRRGSGKYEVRFTCTLMDDQGQVTRKGYAWTADLVLKIVSPVREMKEEDVSGYTSRYFERRQAHYNPPALSLD
jgi:hypothetical protein